MGIGRKYISPQCTYLILEHELILCTSLEVDFYEPEIGYGDPSLE